MLQASRQSPYFIKWVLGPKDVLHIDLPPNSPPGFRYENVLTARDVFSSTKLGMTTAISSAKVIIDRDTKHSYLIPLITELRIEARSSYPPSL